jgi:hypothetical protein
MDQDEMSNHYRGPSIDASYQVSIHLAEGYQRRRLKCGFSPDTPASSTTKTGLHDIAEILLKVALNTINQIFC